MTERLNAPQVGAPDPEKRNSEVVEETDEEFDVLGQEVPELPVCYFNGVTYTERSFVCSGDELLQCSGGVWVRVGSCDPVNP